MIAILDFGSQYTQLIAKAFRQEGFASEVISGSITKVELETLIQLKEIRALVLSGSPKSVNRDVLWDRKILDLETPILAICYGYQLVAKELGGVVTSGNNREYGSSRVYKNASASTDPLFRTAPEAFKVWMSHGDHVEALPAGAVELLSSDSGFAAFSVPQKNIWALQFHPEVHHSEWGRELLCAFASHLAMEKKTWDLKAELEKKSQFLKEKLSQEEEVLCAVSGGVDSTVLAVLLSQVAPVRALFVDHGFQRTYDERDLRAVFAHYPNIKLEVIDAKDFFWKSMESLSDPEEKRKHMGRLFIECFESHVKDLSSRVLAQGTIYSDVIESAANPLAQTEKIKSHHNVGGMPLQHSFEILEPLRNLFKDEVREMGKHLGIDEEFLNRHPFPGPGLSIRCLGPLSRERIAVLAKADELFIEELKKRGLYQKTWQAFCVLLPIDTVGVMGDERSYENVLALRAVNSSEAMTAEVSELPMDQLKEIAARLVNSLPGINRVVYDITSKPPATIEWE